jgi:phosphoribosyl-AMP cyclohydrolase
MINRKISLEELFSKRSDRVDVVTYEPETKRILSLNITNREAFEKTLATGQCHYYDDINNVIYLKGEHSGEIETILSVQLDCCHARRHKLHLLYKVKMAEGECKFGVKDCHFYTYDGRDFVFNSDIVSCPDSVKTYSERLETLLSDSEDDEHQRRFSKL